MMVNREELYRLIDGLPDTQLRQIKALLEPFVNKKQTAVAELLVLVETGYSSGREGRSPCRDPHELHERRIS